MGNGTGLVIKDSLTVLGWNPKVLQHFRHKTIGIVSSGSLVEYFVETLSDAAFLSWARK